MKNYLIILTLICVVFPGCFTPKGDLIQPQEISVLNQEQEKRDYVLGAGDKLAVKFFFNQPLNDEVYIRPDGKISLQLVDEIQAAGLTASELDDVLTQAYAKALKTSSDKYVLAVGDQISIKSYYHEKLNDLAVVRPDGKISLQLVDEVQAAGLTPAQLDAHLTEKYSSFLESPDLSVGVISFNRPDLSVIVKEFSEQNVYVGGEVIQPDVFKISGKLRILDAIIQAKGVLETGDMAKVILIRRGVENTPDIHLVNMESVLLGDSQDIWLKPYDIVYVPKTDIANIESFVRTHLWDLLPSQVGFSFLYNWNNEVQVKQ